MRVKRVYALVKCKSHLICTPNLKLTVTLKIYFKFNLQKKVSKDETKNQKFVFQFIFERLNHSNNCLLHG
ncbi:MAG: hypothetical protein CMB82_04895 [Flammeovirgaceae bacterium]|nr:hypothetical protein [Flammeovirgaceae bacterium]